MIVGYKTFKETLWLQKQTKRNVDLETHLFRFINQLRKGNQFHTINVQDRRILLMKASSNSNSDLHKLRKAV